MPSRAPTPFTRSAVLALAIAALTAACAQLPGGFDLSALGALQTSQDTQTQQSEYARSEATEEVNGKEVRAADEDEDEAPRRKSRRASRDRDRDDDDARDRREPREDEDEDDVPRKRASAKADADDIGATCKKNHECSAKACFVGNGDLGYCTKMCNSWSDCPSHWACERPGNAPQRICMQR